MPPTPCPENREPLPAEHAKILLAAAGDIAAILDPDGRIQDIGAPGAALLGPDEAHLAGTDFMEHLAPGDGRDRLGHAFTAVVGGAVPPKPMAADLLTAGGSISLVWTLAALPGPDGRPAEA